MSHRRVVIPLLMLALATSAGPAVAQDPRLEAARKEGKVVWYTSLALSSAEKVAKLYRASEVYHHDASTPPAVFQ